MGVRTPSKYLSIRFLQELQRERYLSPNGKEYCAEEVDDLLIQKLCVQAERQEIEYMRELSRLALELQSQSVERTDDDFIFNSGYPPQGGFMQAGGGDVLNIAEKLKQKAERDLGLLRRKCCECGHEVATEDDWVIGTDVQPTASDPLGGQDSGVFICPKCDALQEHTILDGMVKFNEETGDLECNIPGFLIDDLYDMEFEGEGMKFNLGVAIVNAVRMQLIRRYGVGFIDQCYPRERAWLRQKLKEMEA